MPILKEKAKENLESAQILKGSEKLSSSIHCYYYACLQTSKHVLCKCCRLSYEQQAAVKIDSHKYVIDTLFNSIKDDKGGVFDAIKFRDKINNLKKNRKKADYDNERIDPDLVNQSELLCFSVLNIIRKKYNYDS